MLNIVKTSLVVLLSFLVPLFFTDLSKAGEKDRKDKDSTVLGVEFGKDDKSGSKDDSKSGDKSDDKSGSKDDGKSGSKDDDKSGSKDDGKSGSKDDDKSGSKDDGKSGSKDDDKSGSKDDDDDSSNNPGGKGGKDDDDSGSVPDTGGKGGGGKGGSGGTSAVPEPATVLLMGLGGAAIGIRKLMRKRKSQR